MPVDYEGLSQTEYIGPVGHEKKLHKTHFQIKNKKKLKGENKAVWVEYAPGRFKLVVKDELHTI